MTPMYAVYNTANKQTIGCKHHTIAEAEMAKAKLLREFYGDNPGGHYLPKTLLVVAVRGE